MIPVHPAVVVAVIIAIVAIIAKKVVKIIQKQKVKFENAMETIASSTNGKYVHTKEGKRVKGCKHSGRLFDVTFYATEEGDYLETSSPINVNGYFILEIARENIVTRLGEKLGIVRDISTGDVFFDKKYFLKSNDESAVKKIFSENEVQRLIEELLNNCEAIEIQNRKIKVYKQYDALTDENDSGTIDSQIVCQIFEKTAKLAEIIETHSSLITPKIPDTTNAFDFSKPYPALLKFVTRFLLIFLVIISVILFCARFFAEGNGKIKQVFYIYRQDKSGGYDLVELDNGKLLTVQEFDEVHAILNEGDTIKKEKGSLVYCVNGVEHDISKILFSKTLGIMVIGYLIGAILLGVIKRVYMNVINNSYNLTRMGIKRGFNVLIFFNRCPVEYMVSAAKLVGKTGKVYMVDIDPRITTQTQRIISKKNLTNVETLCSTGKTTLSSNSVDVVLLYETLHKLSDQNGVIEEMYRILKPGGILSFGDCHMKKEEIMFAVTHKGLFKLLVPGFRIKNFVKES